MSLLKERADVLNSSWSFESILSIFSDMLFGLFGTNVFKHDFDIGFAQLIKQHAFRVKHKLNICCCFFSSKKRKKSKSKNKGAVNHWLISWNVWEPCLNNGKPQICNCTGFCQVSGKGDWTWWSPVCFSWWRLFSTFLSPPFTKKLKRFLGMVGYCRAFCRDLLFLAKGCVWLQRSKPQTFSLQFSFTGIFT